MEPKMKEFVVRGQIGFLGILPEGAAEWRDVRRANSAPEGPGGRSSTWKVLVFLLEGERQV